MRTGLTGQDSYFKDMFEELIEDGRAEIATGLGEGEVCRIEKIRTALTYASQCHFPDGPHFFQDLGVSGLSCREPERSKSYILSSLRAE